MTQAKACAVAAGVVLLWCGCSETSGSSIPPQVVAVPGLLSPAKGLVVSDFEVWGSAAAASSAVAADGTFSSQSAGWHAGIAFAVPKTGSKLAADAALYMSPSLGNSRLITQGTGYAVGSSSAMAMDATTTVLSMLLLRPTLAHPSVDVATQQLKWMLSKLGAGWPALTDAARAYDAAVVAATDFSLDPSFVAAFGTCLDEVSELPEFTAPVLSPEQIARLAQGLEPPVESIIANDGVKVATLGDLPGSSVAARRSSSSSAACRPRSPRAAQPATGSIGCSSPRA